MKIIVKTESSEVVTHMLSIQTTEDFASMYKLFARATDSHKTISEFMSANLWAGLAQVQGEGAVEGEGGANPPVNAIVYIQNLLDLKDRYDSLLVHTFSNDKFFQQVISHDFEYFLNLNQRSPGNADVMSNGKPFFCEKLQCLPTKDFDIIKGLCKADNF